MKILIILAILTMFNGCGVMTVARPLESPPEEPECRPLDQSITVMDLAGEEDLEIALLREYPGAVVSINHCDTTFDPDVSCVRLIRRCLTEAKVASATP